MVEERGEYTLLSSDRQEVFNYIIFILIFIEWFAIITLRIN